MESKYTFKNGIKDGLPICFGYLCVSIGFGISAVNKGIPALAAVIISMTNLTSAGQLAGADIIAAGGLFAEMIAVQLTINCRYALMGISLTQKLDKSFNTAARLAASFFITDEIFTAASIKPGRICAKYFYGLSLTPYIGWAAGTLTGAIAGTLLPSNIRLSLGIAIYGMFIAIIIPAVKTDKGSLIAVLCAALLSTVMYIIPPLKSVSGGFSLIICAVGGAVIAAAAVPVHDDEDSEGNT